MSLIDDPRMGTSRELTETMTEVANLLAFDPEFGLKNLAERT